jgi:hypothetical protein
MDKFEEAKEYLLENHFNLELDCDYYLYDIIEFAMDYHQKQLELTAVSQRSELLDFRKWQKDNWKDVYLYSDEFMVETYLKSNCG